LALVEWEFAYDKVVKEMLVELELENFGVGSWEHIPFEAFLVVIDIQQKAFVEAFQILAELEAFQILAELEAFQILAELEAFQILAEEEVFRNRADLLALALT
jgi:hypothetical protein